MSNTVDVYWGMHTAYTRQTLSNLLWKPPVPLSKLLPEGSGGKEPSGGSYRKCSAGIEYWKNTYALLHPEDSTVKVGGDYNNPHIVEADPAYWFARPNALKEQYRVDLDFAWLFFAEEPVKIQQTPPFLHNTYDRKDGFVSAGEFDISQWFRPINLAYNLWNGSDSLSVKQDEPAVYLNFLTDKKVRLRRFELTPELDLLSQQIVQFKMLSPHEPLNKLYDRFIGSKRHKQVLKLIKDNLLD